MAPQERKKHEDMAREHNKEMAGCGSAETPVQADTEVETRISAEDSSEDVKETDGGAESIIDMGMDAETESAATEEKRGREKAKNHLRSLRSTQPP